MLRAVAISAAVLLLLMILLGTSPISAVIAVAVAFAPMALILRDAAKQALAEEKRKRAVGSALTFPVSTMPLFAQILEGWLRDPGDVISAAFAAIFAVLNVAMSIVFYRWGLQAAELPEAEEATLTPEERYALRERMQRRMNRWRIAAFGRIPTSPYRAGQERDVRDTSQEDG